MDQAQVHCIEFFGGPLDGHRQSVSGTYEEIHAWIAIPVNRNVVGSLGGRRAGTRKPATSVAVYWLDETEAVPRYLYAGPALPSQFQLVNWRG